MNRHLPSHPETLLLQAALRPGDEAVGVWQAWQKEVEFEQVDLGSQRLLPLLHANLKRLGVRDPILAKYEGIHKRHWYKDRLLMDALERVLKVLAEHRLPVVLIKGAAFNALGFYQPGMRPMSDLDLMVPLDRAREAAALLLAAGWTRISEDGGAELSPADLRFGKEAVFKKGPELEIELHWECSWEFYRGAPARELWANASGASLRGHPFLVLHPADHLLLVCAHGAAANRITPIRWVGDALVLLRHTSIDWTYLVAHARQHRLVYPVRNMLRYLNEHFDAKIPATALADLDRAPVGRMEKRYWDTMQTPYPEHGVMQVVETLGYDLVRLTGGRPGAGDFAGYFAYLWKPLWKAKSGGGSLWVFLGWLMGRIRRFFGAKK